MERLFSLVGRERDVDDVARTLYAVAGEVAAPVVGALHLTCSDECERECVDAFRNNFAEHVLPSLKFGERSHFRMANLGGRYEKGAVQIMDDHYSTTAAARAFKLLVVKINSHVSVEPVSGELRFGSMRRYDKDSIYCGALHALLDGSPHPFADDLREAFASGGMDRLGTLLDPDRVNPSHRSLFVAMVNCSLQGRAAIRDILECRPKTPALFAVLSSVTLNKRGRDAEIVCGIHRVDWRGDEPTTEYHGIGDDPSSYRLKAGRAGLEIEDVAAD